MKLFKLILYIIFSVLLITGCENKNTLYLYNWSDYINPDIIQQFEIDNNCRVVIDTFESNEMLTAKIQNSTNTGYDIIFPSSYEIPAISNKLEFIDKNKIPNFINNYDDVYDYVITDKNMTYSIPYSISFCGFAYRSDCIDNIYDIDDILNKNLSKRICLLDDARQVLSLALIKLGYSCNTTNITEILNAQQLVLTWKKHISAFDSGMYKNGLTSGQFYISHGFSNDLLMLSRDMTSIKFILPKSGYTVTCDQIAILAASKNKDLAYKFIDFLYKPENCAKNIEYILGSMPSVAAKKYVSEELLNNELIFPTTNLLQNASLILDLGDNNELYYNAWNKIH